MHIAKQIIYGKKLEEYYENINLKNFEKQYGKIIQLYVYIFINNTLCMQLTCCTIKDAIYIYK